MSLTIFGKTIGYTSLKEYKNRSLNKKLKALTITNKNRKAAKERKLEFIENYVVNKSNEQFSQNNYRYLKKRLSYAVKEETIVDIEAGVKYAQQEEGKGIREELGQLLSNQKTYYRIDRKTSLLSIIQAGKDSILLPTNQSTS